MSDQNGAFPPTYFTRYDESDDSHFYAHPRMTVHIDNRAISAVEALYQELLPPNANVLDLMSSWRSHIPANLRYQRLVGLGLNAAEMEENPQLNTFLVHDLNTNPALPFAEGSFDGAICTVSVQYLTRPVEVFAEVGRVLRPGAPFIVTFSNRCFPSKAVQIWTATDDRQHLELVQLYFHYAICFEHVKAYDRCSRAWWGDPLYGIVGRKKQSTGQ